MSAKQSDIWKPRDDISFDQLFSMQFFRKELIYWLNAKDAGRLKRCSKTLNSLIQMGDVLIESEPLVFRRLIFQKKFEILEKCIPFRINKQKKYPSLASNLSKGFASVGNLKGLQNLELQPTIKLMHWSALFSAVESNQKEIVQFLIRHWVNRPKLILTNTSLALFRKAYSLNHKEIAMMLLEHYLSKEHERWKILFELILKEQTKNNSREDFIEYFMFLALNPSRLDDPYILPFLENLEKPIVTSELRIRMQQFPFLIPPRIISEFEAALEDVLNEQLMEKSQFENVLKHAKVRWSVFVGDFQTFKSIVTSCNFILEQLSTYLAGQSVSEFVMERTIQRNLNLEFFKHCLKLMTEYRNSLTTGSIKIISKLISKSIQFRRFDLFHQFLSNGYWLSSMDVISALGRYGNSQFWNAYIEQTNFSLHQNLSVMEMALGFAIESLDYETLDFLLKRFPKNKKIDTYNIVICCVSCGDIDLMEKMNKVFPFITCWTRMMRHVLQFEDEEVIDFVLKLTKSDPNGESLLQDFIPKVTAKETRQILLQQLEKLK